MAANTETRNWTDMETEKLCRILAYPLNNNINTLEQKALKKTPTKEVFDAKLDEVKETFLEPEFCEVNAKHFSKKEPYPSLELDSKRLQVKYYNIKSGERQAICAKLVLD